MSTADMHQNGLKIFLEPNKLYIFRKVYGYFGNLWTFRAHFWSSIANSLSKWTKTRLSSIESQPKKVVVVVLVVVVVFIMVIIVDHKI